MEYGDESECYVMVEAFLTKERCTVIDVLK